MAARPAGARIMTATSPAFRLPNLVRDAARTWSRRSATQHVDAVIGHDFGSSVAAWCALIRPDVFRAVVMMSAPFSGPPSLPFNTANEPAKPATEDPVHRELAALPRPRKHYQWYYSTRPANADMHRAPQGVHDFLRAYYHHKSADWKDNKPYPLQSWSARRTGKAADLLRDGSRPGHGRDGRRGDAVARGDRRQHLAAGSRACPITARNIGAPDSRAGCNGIAAARQARSTPELQTWSGRSIDQPSALHLGQAGLGHLSAARRVRGDAEQSLHQDDRLPSGRRRRPLGAAGTAGRGEPAAAPVPRACGAVTASARGNVPETSGNIPWNLALPSAGLVRRTDLEEDHGKENCRTVGSRRLPRRARGRASCAGPAPTDVAAGKPLRRAAGADPRRASAKLKRSTRRRRLRAARDVQLAQFYHHPIITTTTTTLPIAAAPPRSVPRYPATITATTTTITTTAPTAAITERPLAAMSATGPRAPLPTACDDAATAPAARLLLCGTVQVAIGAVEHRVARRGPFRAGRQFGPLLQTRRARIRAPRPPPRPSARAESPPLQGSQ